MKHIDNAHERARHERAQVIEGHEVDGISEFDNPMPRWWLYAFYASVVFSIGYALYYTVGPGESVARLYANEMSAAGLLPAATKAEADEPSLKAVFDDKAQVAEGQKLFASRCVACHGDKGQGLVGPNLADDHWVHGGGSLTGIFNVVRDGVPAKGMIAWGTQLERAQMMQLVAYIASLQGSAPPGGKAPEGTRIAKPSWQ